MRVPNYPALYIAYSLQRQVRTPSDRLLCHSSRLTRFPDAVPYALGLSRPCRGLPVFYVLLLDAV